MNIRLLNQYMRRKGLTRGELARRLGMGVGRFCDMLHGRRGLEFSLGQALAIREAMGLSIREMTDLFFAEELS
ncbi:MAG: helix-turn-helix domain-containing protein [Oscillospiraceae bacterium]|nr:helix-turn-helix domain-containing protein [Oscillospiraceae bacterium]